MSTILYISSTPPQRNSILAKVLPDTDFYLVGYSTGGGAAVLAVEMSSNADNIKGVDLIVPALNYTDLNHQAQELQDCILTLKFQR